MWTIRWWLVVGGASRDLWQQVSINIIIKECRIKRRPEEYVNGWGLRVDCIKMVQGFNFVIIMYLMMYILF